MDHTSSGSKQWKQWLRLQFLLLIISTSTLPVSADRHLTTARKALEGRRQLASGQKLAAVNLGGWLVIEGWIKPSLFDNIQDDDLLSGAQIQLKSVTLQTYVSAENGGGGQVVVNRQSASGWETFKVWRVSDGVYSLRVFNNQFLSAQNAGGSTVTATGATPREWETLTMTRGPNNRVHIKVWNGMYMQAIDQSQLTADYSSGSEPGWDDNPATFEMTVNVPSPFHGEYQLATGLGPDRAATVFKEHRDTFITASDFEYLSSAGINAVRIPVGWWIASDPNPPAPFVAGSLQALDNAFQWAEQYNIQIIIDLHAAPGSQNGQEHSGTIDGVSEWATGKDANGNDYITETVSVIDFLASRYGKNSNLYGIELLNEPQQADVSIDILKGYYQRGYEAVRKYTSQAYVVMCQLLGGADPHDLVDLGTSFQNAIIDLHYYNAFGSEFASMTPQQNIDYVNNERRPEIESLNQNGNGLLTFVGEWTNEWNTQGASQQDYQNFGQAQLQVYGEATAGWAYWNYKIDDPNSYERWDFVKSVQQNYLVKPTNGWNS